MLDALAAGLRECSRKPLVGPQLRLDSFLDTMLRSRISRRVIAEQHLHLHGIQRPGWVGVICTDLSLRDAVTFAAQRSAQVRLIWPALHILILSKLCQCTPPQRLLESLSTLYGYGQACRESYGVAPEVILAGVHPDNPQIAHVPSHIDYMLYELLV